jgi:hypothetical protein
MEALEKKGFDFKKEDGKWEKLLRILFSTGAKWALEDAVYYNLNTESLREIVNEKK